MIKRLFRRSKKRLNEPSHANPAKPNQEGEDDTAGQSSVGSSSMELSNPASRQNVPLPAAPSVSDPMKGAYRLPPPPPVTSNKLSQHSSHRLNIHPIVEGEVLGGSLGNTASTSGTASVSGAGQGVPSSNNDDDLSVWSYDAVTVSSRSHAPSLKSLHKLHNNSHFCGSNSVATFEDSPDDFSKQSTEKMTNTYKKRASGPASCEIFDDEEDENGFARGVVKSLSSRFRDDDEMVVVTTNSADSPADEQQKIHPLKAQGREAQRRRSAGSDAMQNNVQNANSKNHMNSASSSSSEALMATRMEQHRKRIENRGQRLKRMQESAESHYSTDYDRNFGFDQFGRALSGGDPTDKKGSGPPQPPPQPAVGGMPSPNSVISMNNFIPGSGPDLRRRTSYNSTSTAPNPTTKSMSLARNHHTSSDNLYQQNIQNNNNNNNLNQPRHHSMGPTMSSPILPLPSQSSTKRFNVNDHNDHDDENWILPTRPDANIINDPLGVSSSSSNYDNRQMQGGQEGSKKKNRKSARRMSWGRGSGNAVAGNK